MKALKHGDLVRLPRWNIVTYASVGTAEGYLGQAMAEHQRRTVGEQAPWACYAGATLTDSADFHRQQREKSASATTLENGELVRIEGRTYRVRVVPGNADSPRNCDPIQFIPHD